MKGLILTSFILFNTAYAESETAWNKHNDPRNFSSDYEYRFNTLPKSSMLPREKMVWSSSYWPRFKGSINYRWNSSNPTGFDLKRPTRAEVERMSQQDLAKLSPAEKFDLAQGHYDYPVSLDVEKGSSRFAQMYEGVCDGWTAASIQYTEPKPVTIKNPDGILIPFGSSDVKALMSYDLSINQEKGALRPVFIGRYCTLLSFGANCDDVHPAALHIVLANEIGLKQTSFAVDVDRGHETWNQPVYGFESKVVRTEPGAVIVNTKLYYAEDAPLEEERKHLVFNWEPTIGTPNFAGTFMELDYKLELDSYGRIIGGEWLGFSRKVHPDLIWKPTAKPSFTKNYEFIYQIYSPNK